MGANPTLSRVLGGVLIVVAIALIVVALTRDGNNMWIALAAVPAALASSACFTAARRQGSRTGA